jgi:hypothetical protein
MATLSGLRCDKERKVFEPAELSDWLSQLCDALDYAHNYADHPSRFEAG